MAYVVNPVALPAARAIPPAPYSGEPSEGVLGVLLNGKEFSSEVLHYLVQRLRDRFRFQEVLWWDKGFPCKPAPTLEEIASRCSVVLTGVGH